MPRNPFDTLDPSPTHEKLRKFLKGDKGDRGEQGIQGNQGIQGPRGPMGPQGFNGKDGKDARDGIDGRDGINGRDGVDGMHGHDGVDGVQITAIRTDNNELIFSLSDGTEISAGDMPKNISPEVMVQGGGAFAAYIAERVSVDPSSGLFSATNVQAALEEIATGGGGGGVTSFNTRTGAVTLGSSDVTTALGYTPVTNARTVNGHALSSNITLSATDVGAPSGSGTSTGTNTGDQTITLTGDVTGSGTGSFATTIANGAVTEVKMTLADNTTNNVSAAKHGFAPKLPNDATKYLDGTGAYTVPAGTGVTSVSGTTNRITSTGGNTPVIDIAATYIGQTSLTTLGTIATGAWQGTKVGLAYGGTNADLSATGGTSQVLKQATSGAAITVGQLAASDLSNGTTGSGGGIVLATGPTMSNPVVGTQSTSDNSTKAASTAYVTTAITNAVAGVNPAVAVQAATTQASDTSGLTYLNGVSGIGATLTGANNVALTIDNYTFTAINQRLLVKNDTQSPSGAYNGVYYVTQVQASLLPLILTRALDYDTPSDINNTGAIPVVNGTLNALTSWLLTSQVTTVGTDALTYTKFSYNPSVVATSSNNLSFFAATTSAQLAGVISDETGSGALVFANSPVFTTPNIGSATGSISGNAATATALQNTRTIGGVSFDGTANIVPQTIQSINEATDTTCFPLFISASGSQSLQPLNNASFTFNSNTATLGATNLSGTLTTAAQANITSVGTLTGGATGAGFTVALGTSTITGILGSANGGTGNGFTKFSGPATSEKTFTLPNGSDTVTCYGTAGTFTAIQTFTNSDLKLLGSSTGATTFTSANAGASNFTITFPAVTDTLACLGTAQQFTKQQNFTAASITSTSASIAWDVSSAQVAKHTATENTTLANPTNLIDGGTYIFRWTQHASSPKTLAYGNAYKWPGGVAPVVTASNGAVDMFTFISDGTNMYGTFQASFS